MTTLDDVDFATLADLTEESPDPIKPETGVPDPENASEETRASVMDYVKSKSRNRPPREPRVKKSAPPKPRPGSLKKPLMEFYGTIGMAVAMRDPICGMAIMKNAEACATALENAAREDETLRRIILALVQTSIWGQIIAAHSPIIFTIAAHHVPALKNNPAAMEMAAAFASNNATQEATESAQ